MQYDYLVFVIIFIFVMMFINYIFIHHKSKIFLISRKAITINKLYNILEKPIQYDLFKSILLTISDAFNLPVEKLRLEDTLKQLSKVSLNQNYEELLEKRLKEFNIQTGELSIDSTIQEIIELVISNLENKEKN